MLNDLEQGQKAEDLLKQAIAEAHQAGFEAGLAYPFLDGPYSERRREAAQQAQDAANDAAQHALMVEENFYRGDYSAVVEASRQLRECLAQAREAARLAMIDETELGRCPKCMTQAKRLTVQPQPANALDDGTRCWTKRFQCSLCEMVWREIYTDEGLLIERMAEAFG